MRKLVFIIGILILLTGIMIARPEYTRKLIEETGSYKDIEEAYNSSYNRTHDTFGENTDVVGYGIFMVGVIFLTISFVRKKEKKGGLLYQSPEHQQIPPEHLLERASKAPPIDSSSDDERDLEIPVPDKSTVASPMSSHTEVLSASSHPIQPNPQDSDTPLTTSNTVVPPPVFQQTASPVYPNPPAPPVVPTPEKEEKTFKCSECGEIFKMAGEVKEVICPRCGTRYSLEGL